MARKRFIKKARKEYSLDLRGVVVTMHSKNLSGRAISRLTGRPKSSINRILQQFATTGTAEISKRPGRPPKLTEREKRLLHLQSSVDPEVPATELKRILNESRPGDPVGVKTVQRALSTGGLPGRSPARKPLVQKRNRKARLRFAKEHQHWTVSEWMNVLWSDESKFELFSDGVRYIHRPVGKRFDPKYTIPTVKHGGGSVMVWGCFLGGQVGPLRRVKGIMKKEQYVEILEEEMLPWAEANCPRGWIFQSDNDPKHSSKYAQKWLTDNNVEVLEWPSQSPDLNPIEHLWGHLKREIRKLKPSNADDKFRLLKEAWEKIPSETLITLVKSMPARCQAVIDSNGYPSKY